MLQLFFTWILCLAVSDGSSQYLQPGTPEVGGVRQLCLIYHGQKCRVPWTKQALLPYVAYVDPEGKPVDWLFDSFLFIEFAADNGAQLYHYQPKEPLPTMAEWQWLADAWFRPTTGLIGLEQAVAEAGRVLGDPDHVVNVVITLPVPHRQLNGFGPLPGQEQKLDFGREEDRQQAMRWYIDSVRDRYRQGNYAHLRLVGFYWTGESIDTKDHAIVQWTGQFLHDEGYKFYWIPYFSASGFERWKQLGFDAVMLQPNHFFTDKTKVLRLTETAQRALLAGAGVEMEFDSRALGSEAFRQRFYDYFDAGVAYGWMKEAVLGWYEGGGTIKAFLEKPEVGRPMYDTVYRFIKGTYQPTGQPLPPRPEIRQAPPGNLALASKGAKITGAVRRDDQPGLAPEHIIDGQFTHYAGAENFGYFGIPGSFTIELPEPATVARCETLLWDQDERWYQYRIETSLDGQQWEPAIDKSTGQWHSWQVDRFSPRQAKYVRFTGLHNSTGQSVFQVVEMEVFGGP
jgi:hypothetical protein